MKKQTGKGLSFVKRMYLPRCLGLGLGSLSVAAALHPLQPSVWVWALLLFQALGAAHVEYHLARFSSHPYRAERRNLMFDSMMGGFWAGAIGLNPLPAAAILGMIAMNNITSGGQTFFWRGCLAQMVGALTAVAIFSPSFVMTNTPLQLYASLPLLLIYPLFVGLAGYKLAVKLSEHKNQLGILSRTDSLTGLLNHGTWKDLLQLEYGTCQAMNRSTTIALIDIDHFKTINDTHGHIVGDNVLKQLSTELVNNLRDTDLAGRYGGDEFCVILPDTSLSQATEILERLRQTVNHHHDPLTPSLTMSLSIGIAAYKPHFSDAGAWLNEADTALYAAKSTGRNKINLAPVESIVFTCALGTEIG